MSKAPALAAIALVLAAGGTSPAAAGDLPVLQSGKWMVKGKVDGQSYESTLCGNPLDRVAAAIAAARDMEKLGCRVEIRSPVPRTTSVRVDCPADRSSAGGAQRVPKGSSELLVNAASMQSVTIELWREGRHETVDADRVGECD
jgi:hypothetical protein